MIPGIHPHRVRKNTIVMEPQPLSITAKGGKRIENNARQKLITLEIIATQFNTNIKHKNYYLSIN